MSGMEEASDDLLALVAGYYARTPEGMEFGPNADEILGALAAISADQLIRLCVSPENIRQSSRWVIGNEVDDLLYKGEADTLFTVIESGALAAGMEYEDLPERVPIIARASMGDELAIVPPLTVPEQYFPPDWPPNAAVRFRAEANGILDRHAIKGAERAIACAYATAKMLRVATEGYPDPQIPLLISLETLAGVARMTPLEKEI